MSDITLKKITELTELDEAPAIDDEVVVVDTGAGTTKRISIENLLSELLNILKFAETVNEIGSVDAGDSPVSIDMSLGGVHTITIARDVTIQFTNWPSATESCKAEIIMIDGDQHTVTWPAAVIWPNGTAPDLTGRTRLVFATENNGTSIDGFQSGEGIS